jgi:hypothetical protein
MKDLTRTANDGAGPQVGTMGQENREPRSEEPTGRSPRDGFSAAPSPVADGQPQPIVALLDAEVSDTERWEETMQRVREASPSPDQKTLVERMLDRMDA